MIDDRCPCCEKIIESMTSPFGVGYCGCASPLCPYCVWCCPSRNTTKEAEALHKRFCPRVSGRVLDR